MPSLQGQNGFDWGDRRPATYSESRSAARGDTVSVAMDPDPAPPSVESLHIWLVTPRGIGIDRNPIHCYLPRGRVELEPRDASIDLVLSLASLPLPVRPGTLVIQRAYGDHCLVNDEDLRHALVHALLTALHSGGGGEVDLVIVYREDPDEVIHWDMVQQETARS